MGELVYSDLNGLNGSRWVCDIVRISGPILGLSRMKDLVKSVTLDIMSQQSSNDVALGLEMNL